MASDRFRPAAGRRANPATGSVLVLMPAAVLIVIVLGALAVDRAVVFGAQRDLVATAQAAANDAAAVGVDLDRMRADGVVRHDPALIERAVTRTVAAGAPGADSSWSVEGDVVVVRLRRRVDLVFTRGVPGAAGTQVVTATARADLVRR